jgi:hypothetical protein
MDAILIAYYMLALSTWFHVGYDVCMKKSKKNNYRWGLPGTKRILIETSH